MTSSFFKIQSGSAEGSTVAAPKVSQNAQLGLMRQKTSLGTMLCDDDMVVSKD